MRVLVTGIFGQLGNAVAKELAKRGIEVLGNEVSRMDVSDGIAMKHYMRKMRPDAVIHCAAWTNVDEAENPANREKVEAVNVYATQNLADLCKELDCKMLYVSSNFVFSGTGLTPWQEDSTPYPLNVYGRTKAEGEEAVISTLSKYFIVRTSWIFSATGHNFVKSMLDIGKKQESVEVVDDQIGLPTYAPDLARFLVDLIESEEYGIYHATNTGACIDLVYFAREIFKQVGYKTRVIPLTTATYGAQHGAKAPRPLNGQLSMSMISQKGFTPLPKWQDALERCLKEVG